MDADVLIVGGGMVGTTLAVALASADVPVAIIDRDTPAQIAQPTRDGRASAIASGSQAVLDVLGVWPRVAADAQPILQVRVSDTDSLLFLHYDHRDLGDKPLGAIVENHVIRRALNARLAELPSARVIGGRTVTLLERDAHRATAVLDDGARITARLAIAADGRNSPLRRAAGIDVVEWTYPQTGIVCTVRHERDHGGIAHERFLPAGPFAILPLPGKRASLVWTERADIAKTILALDDAAFAAELGLRFGDFLGALEVDGARYAHPLSLLHAQSYIAPRLALAGDAAHAIHPIAGQGLNLGLRDVAALAEVIVDALRLGLDPGSTAVLAGYERWRRFDNTVMMAVTDSLNRLFSNRSAPLRLARDTGLAAVNRMPGLKRLFMRHAMGLVGDLPRLVRGQEL